MPDHVPWAECFFLSLLPNDGFKMAKYLKLQHSESVVVAGATQIYAAYISTGRVEEGQEDQWLARAIKEAIKIATTADAAIVSNDEMDN